MQEDTDLSGAIAAALERYRRGEPSRFEMRLLGELGLRLATADNDIERCVCLVLLRRRLGVGGGDCPLADAARAAEVPTADAALGARSGTPVCTLPPCLCAAPCANDSIVA